MEINDRGNISCAGVIHSNGWNSETYTPIIFLHKNVSINTRLWWYRKTLPGMNKKVSYHQRLSRYFLLLHTYKFQELLLVNQDICRRIYRRDIYHSNSTFHWSLYNLGPRHFNTVMQWQTNYGLNWPEQETWVPSHTTWHENCHLFWH